MINLSINKIKNFPTFLEKKRYFIFGELHGSKQNIFLLKKIVSVLCKKDIKLYLGLEWKLLPESERFLKKFLLSESHKIQFSKEPFFLTRDGRFSKEHLRFLFWLRNLNKKLKYSKKILIIPFDKKSKTWNARDKKMASVLLKKYPQNRLIIIFTGNLHARKEAFLIKNRRYTPMASYFPKKKTVSILMTYSRGSIYNNGLREVKNSQTKALKNFDKFFDSSFVVTKSTPINPCAKDDLRRLDNRKIN